MAREVRRRNVRRRADRDFEACSSRRVPIDDIALVITVQRTFLIVVIAVLLSLLLFVHIPGNSAWLRAAVNAGHAPVFAGVAAVLAILLRRRGSKATVADWPDLRRYVRAFALALTIGVAIEVVQTIMKRPGSLFDVFTNAAGAVIGLCALAFVERSPSPRPAGGPKVWPLVVAALAGVLFVLWEPLQTARAYAARQQGFPVLAEFGNSTQLPMTRTLNTAIAIEPVAPKWTLQPDERALHVRFGFGKSGNAWPVRYLSIEPSPDWRGYATLALDLVNTGAADLRLTLRIADATHHWEFDPPPAVLLVVPARTRTTVRVGLDTIGAASTSRAPDLARIAYMLLVPAEPDRDADFLLASIRLEK